MEIDFVIPWVDGSDPIWQNKKNKYVSLEKASGQDIGEERYRDWGILHYWFRSIEKNAPWVRHIYLITDHQIPTFLNINHSKLKLVSHEDYIPEEYLPTFSSRTIELNLHRIPGLSEHFVYFNDDVFLNRPVDPVFFFRNNKPCYSYIERPMVMRYPIPNYQYTTINNMAVINRYHRKRKLQRHPGLCLNYRYARHLPGNMMTLPWPAFLSFVDEHVPYPMLVSTITDVWQTAEEALKNTCRHKFRTREDVNQYLFRYWDLVRGNFSPHHASAGFYNVSEKNVDECCEDICRGYHPLLTVNDSSGAVDYEMLSRRIQEAFQKRYPEKSSYEK